VPKYWAVPREWAGQRSFIVAGGPSYRTQSLELLRGRNVVAVNRSFEDVPWAQYVFGMDKDFFVKHRAGLETFAGRIVTNAPGVPLPDVLLVEKAKKPNFAGNSGQIHCNRTSLAGAMELAALLGTESMVLIGADGRNDDEAARAHKERYPYKPHRPPRYDDWRKELMAVAAALKRLGVPVANCSPGSTYADLWPIVTLEEALKS
jgi:hypothetical protein